MRKSVKAYVLYFGIEHKIYTLTVFLAQKAFRTFQFATKQTDQEYLSRRKVDVLAKRDGGNKTNILKQRERKYFRKYLILIDFF